jgi:TolB-like protein/tetratricopeptide (TPR) repeat protein
MKRCPECRREYDSSMMFCLDDGAELLYGPASSKSESPSSAGGQFDEPQTAILHETAPQNEAATRAQIQITGETAVLPSGTNEIAQRSTGFDKRLLFAPIVLAIVAIGGFFGYRYVTAEGTKQIESIAVMPFVNESGSGEIEYLSDGMTETLISSLTKLPNLSVKSRSSVFRYKGKETDAKTLGSELNVQAVLNGRVAQRGDQLTLSLELVDVTTENAVWSQQYTRKQSDLVSLQSEIARDVSGSLRSRLSGAEVAKVAKNYTADPEAYQLYLKGRFQWNRRTPESLKQAVEFFGQAIEKDPNYALAYSGLAESYVLFPNYSVATPMDCMPKAKAAALRAIELDDSLAESHVALGIYYSNFAWNLPASEMEFRRAIELNPNYATAYQQFGIECLAMVGRFDEAIAVAKRAEELDPVSPIIGADLGNIMIRARRFDDSIVQLERVLKLDQNFWVAHWYLGIAHFGKGNYAEAVTAYRTALAFNGNPWVKALLVQSLVKMGKRDEAVRLLAELQSESERRYVSSSSLAIAHAALGRKGQGVCPARQRGSGTFGAPPDLFILSSVGRPSQRPALR